MSVNGVFSATYDNYLIVIRNFGANANGSLLFRLRSGGTDATGNNYGYQILIASDTSVSGSRSTSQDLTAVGYTSNGKYNGDHVYVYGPALAQPTAMRNINANGSSDARIEEYASTHSLSTAYDGFTIFVSGGSINTTGALTVYGLAQ
jgi:hypothetical protein